MKCVVNIGCALRWGVVSVGIILYWALLTLLWDPLLGAGYVHVADPHSLVSKYSLFILVNRCVMIVLHNVCYMLCGLYV